MTFPGKGGDFPSGFFLIFSGCWSENQEMGSGEKNFLNSHFHFHIHHGNGGNKREETRDIPKGCLAVLVGQGEEQQRFVIPVIYINHPLFMELLKEAEEEYGFEQTGPIAIPCHVEEFRYVQGMIDKEKSHHHHHHHHHYDGRHHHHHHHHCFCV